MSLRIGPRKALGLAALVVVAAVAMAVWRAVGTDGLVLMALRDLGGSAASYLGGGLSLPFHTMVEK